MESLSPEQQRLFETLVTAMEKVDKYPMPELALAVHFGTAECPSTDQINRVSASIRGAVNFLHRKNAEAFQAAVEAVGGSFAFRVNAILHPNVEAEKEDHVTA